MSSSDNENVRCKKYAHACVKMTDELYHQQLDYSIESLKIIDEIIDQKWSKERFKGVVFGDFKNEDAKMYTSLVLMYSSYFGEVLVRAYSGKWIQSETLGSGLSSVFIFNTEVNVLTVAARSFHEPSLFYRTYLDLKTQFKGSFS